MDAPAQPAATFSHSWLVSVWATVTSIGLLLMGIFTVLSIHPTCWFVGGYIIAIAIGTAVMEAPFLAKLHAYAERLTSVTARLQYWHKGVIFFVLTIPVFFCIGFASVIAIILILSNGVGYFVLAIGPKGTRTTNNAGAGAGARPSDAATLLGNAELGTA